MKAIRGLAAVLPAALVAGWTAEAGAWSPRLEVEDDLWLQVGYLHQFWAQADVEDGPYNDFFTRRNRLLLQGQVHESVEFLVNYDAQGAEFSPVLTDGYVDLQLADEFNLAIGRILVPFGLNQKSAVTLNAIDYAGFAVGNLPSFVAPAFWRDDGLEARGLLADDRIDYRVGFFRGDRDLDLNADGLPRYSAMVMLNLGDPQGMFWNNNSLGALEAVSLGGGFDHALRSDADDYMAWNVFALVEQPIGEGHLSGNAAFYGWLGEDGVDDRLAGEAEGYTAQATAGYLLPGVDVEPLARYQLELPEEGDEIHTVGLGLGYYLRSHHINFKGEYALSTERNDTVSVQTQLWF